MNMPSPLTILRRSFKRRRAGKISALPEPIREQINLMIDDGFTYAQIIERLGDVGKTLNKDNLSRWRLHQHQDWLEEQRFKELVSRHKQLAANEPAKDLLRIHPGMPQTSRTLPAAKPVRSLPRLARTFPQQSLGLDFRFMLTV